VLEVVGGGVYRLVTYTNRRVLVHPSDQRVPLDGILRGGYLTLTRCKSMV